MSKFLTLRFRWYMFRFTLQFSLEGWTWLYMIAFNFSSFSLCSVILLQKYRFISHITFFSVIFTLESTIFFISLSINFIEKLILFNKHLILVTSAWKEPQEPKTAKPRCKSVLLVEAWLLKDTNLWFWYMIPQTL